jgi:hypothetical protein
MNLFLLPALIIAALAVAQVLLLFLAQAVARHGHTVLRVALAGRRARSRTHWVTP